MSALIAVALTASLSIPPAGRPATVETARPSLASQVTALALEAPPASMTATGTTCVQAGGDSLKNGAVTGALVGGGAMLLYASLLCRDTRCAPDVLMWTGLAAGAGALAGAGIDALFARAPSLRMRVRF